MVDDDKFRELDADDFDTTEPIDLPLLADDDTITTELVKVEPGTDVPFSLPHVSELDEKTPRDARRDPGKLVTLPAYNQIVPSSESASTEINRPIPSAIGDRSEHHSSNAPGARSARPSEDRTLAIPRFPESAAPAPAPPKGLRHASTDAVNLPRKRRPKRRILGMPIGCIWVLAGVFLTFCSGFTLLTAGAAIVFLPQVEARMDRARRRGG